MEINHDTLEKNLPKVFKYFNHVMVNLWRLGLGKLINIWPAVIGRIMVIKHNGRKSGTTYFTPVNYTEEDGVVYCTAGFGADSDWFLNLMANPQVEIWLPDGWYVGTAEVVKEPELRLPFLRLVFIASGFAARLFGVDPINMDDDEHNEVTGDYILLQINRQSPRTGADGPGGLAWLWPFILAFFLLGRRKRRK